jgi:hypothetical protein
MLTRRAANPAASTARARRNPTARYFRDRRNAAYGGSSSVTAAQNPSSGSPSNPASSRRQMLAWQMSPWRTYSTARRTVRRPEGLEEPLPRHPVATQHVIVVAEPPGRQPPGPARARHHGAGAARPARACPSRAAGTPGGKPARSLHWPSRGIIMAQRSVRGSCRSGSSQRRRTCDPDVSTPAP